MGCNPRRCNSASSMANDCCSIDLEPRTLREGQISQAKEVAVGIIQKKEPNEQSSMLVQGTKPVSSVKEAVLVVQQEVETLKIEDATRDKINVNSNSNSNIKETTCQCSCAPSSSGLIDSPEQFQQPNEPLSAPF